MRPSKRPSNHSWVSFSKKLFQWPLKEAKNKSDQNDLILKSYFKYHMWGLQKCKNNQKIPTRRCCTHFKIQLLYYCGLNGVMADFTLWPLLRPNWVGAVNFGLEYIQQSLDNACLSSCGDLKGKQLVKSWFLEALWFWMSHPVLKLQLWPWQATAK